MLWHRSPGINQTERLGTHGGALGIADKMEGATIDILYSAGARDPGPASNRNPQHARRTHHSLYQPKIVNTAGHCHW